MTLEQSIRHHAQTTPYKIAVECGAERTTYADLWAAIERKSTELKQSNGVRPHVFRATQDTSFLITYCAIHHSGGIAVPLEQSVSDEVFLTVSEEVNSYDYADDIVDILYTTGTTGKSKGVMLSETCLTSCAENFIYDLGFTDEHLFIVSGPLNHIASLFKIHPILTVGGTLSILDGLRDIGAFFDVFNLPYRRFATFMVPASLRMLMQFSYDQLCSLRDRFDFIETGAAPITSDDMRRLSEALPHTRLYNTYGGTEIGCVCTYQFNDGRYLEGCIGRPMRNSSIEVTPDGDIIVSGRTIMSGYVGDPQKTAEVMPDGRIHGSDLGRIDSEGMIHITGRKGDVINVGGYKVDPVEVESAASSFAGIKDCICIATTHPVMGTVLKLLYVASSEISLPALAKHIGSKLERHKVPQQYQHVDAIQRTYNGKLDRKYYR